MPAKFQSKFDPSQVMHIAQMLQILHALSIEINHPPLRHSHVNFAQHARDLGWVPTSTKPKWRVLIKLVELAQSSSMNYTPRGSVLRALETAKSKEKVK